jgi:hypothetical protein
MARCTLLLLCCLLSYVVLCYAAPLRVLYDSWLYIPHSYAIVSCMELLHLLRQYGPNGTQEVELFVHEPPYYRPEWNGKRALAYDSQYNDALEHGLQRWSGERVDVVLRRSYPHDLSSWPGESEGVPLLLFYTSEYGAWLPTRSFSLGRGVGVPPSTAAVAKRIASSVKLFTPSTWSARGAAAYGTKAALVPHGVDGRCAAAGRANTVRVRLCLTLLLRAQAVPPPARRGARRSPGGVTCHAC